MASSVLSTGSGAPPPGEVADEPDHGDAPSPWWHSPWRLVALAVALVFLGGAGGYAFSQPDHPGPRSADAGFLQDMRYHHDQGVRMSMLLLQKPIDGADPRLRTIAREIVLGQQLENGLMVQLLRDWHLPEANQTDTAMAWMGMLLPIDEMPGLATDDEIERLTEATGPEADRLFVELMVGHHEGGIHMATDAVARADTSEVRQLATAMATAQRSEIVELQGIAAQLQPAG